VNPISIDASSQSVARGLLAQQPHSMQNDSTKSASGAKSAVLIPSKDPSKDNAGEAKGQF
jgi:hypothetical protein